jgi:TonB family protein
MVCICKHDAGKMKTMVATPVNPEPRLPRSAGAWLFSILAHVFILVHFVGPAVVDHSVPEGTWVEMMHADAPRHKARRNQPASISEDPLEKAEAVPPIGNTQKAVGHQGEIGHQHGAEASIRDRFLYELEAFINQYKVYPARARRLGQTGKVEVAFHLNQDGSITDPHVVKPCIHDLLNKAALDLVVRASKFRPIPPELKTPLMHVTVPIEYELK